MGNGPEGQWKIVEMSESARDIAGYIWIKVDIGGIRLI
jgi:hypothetical protein